MIIVERDIALVYHQEKMQG